MPKRQRKTPSWADVKSALAGFDRPGLLALIQAMYTADKRNQAFLHARFGLGESVLAPYKKTIARWISPDVFSDCDTSVSKAKQAVSDYRKAAGDPAGLLELMVFYCECASNFCSEYGNDDAGYYDALVLMFQQALVLLDTLPADLLEEFVARLNRVRDTCRNFGYGVSDAMDDLLMEYDVIHN